MREISFKSANNLYKEKKFNEALEVYKEIAISNKYSESLKKSAFFSIQLTERKLRDAQKTKKGDTNKENSNNVIFVGSHSKYRNHFFDILKSELEKEKLFLMIWDNLGTMDNWDFKESNNLSFLDIRPEFLVKDNNFINRIYSKSSIVNDAQRILEEFKKKYGESWLYSISSSNYHKEFDLSDYIFRIAILLLDIKPKYLFIWHQFRVSSETIKRVCDIVGISYDFYEWGYLPGTISKDEKGQMGESRLSKIKYDDNFLINTKARLEQAVDYIVSAKTYSFRRRAELAEKSISAWLGREKTKKKVITFFCDNSFLAGVSDKSSLAYLEHSPLGLNNIDIIEYLCGISERNNYKFIVKIHPNDETAINEIANNKRLESYIKKEVLFPLRKCDFHELIRFSDLCITHVSQSSYSILLEDKPLIQLGKTQITDKGCCYEINALKELEQTVMTALRHGRTESQKRHLIALTSALLENHYFYNGDVLKSDSENINEAYLCNKNKTIDEEIKGIFKKNTKNINYVAGRRLKIGIISSFKKGVYSGGRFHAWLIAKGYLHFGHKVVFITNEYPSYFEENEENYNNLDFFIQNIKGKFIDTKNQKFDIIYIIPESNMHRSGLLKNIMNLIKTNNLTAYIFVNFESHSFFNKYSLVKREEKMWTGWDEIAKASDVTLSSTQLSAKFAEYDYESKNHFVTYPTITKPNDIDQRKEHESQITGDYVVSFVSNHKHKGIDRLIKFAKKGFNGYKLVTVCGISLDQEKISQLEFACKESKTEWINLEKISEKDKYHILTNAKALIYLTSFEGFGLPPMEALSCRTPIIAYKLDVLKEIYGESLTWIDDSLMDLGKTIKNLKRSKKITREINAYLDFDLFSADLLMNGLIAIENKNFKKSQQKPLKIIKSYTRYDQYASTLRLFIDIQSEGFPKIDVSLNNIKYRIDYAKQTVSGIYKAQLSRYLPKLNNKNIEIVVKDSTNQSIQKDLPINNVKTTKLQNIKEKGRSRICFFPEFGNSDFKEFSNHLQRAMYYLVGNSALASNVSMYAPKYFYSLFNPNTKDMEIVDEANITIKEPSEFDKDFEKEKTLYIWRKLTNNEEEKLKNLSPRKKVYVETNNPDIAEYGKYSASLWMNLSEEERSEILEFSHFNYKKFMANKLDRFNKSVVFCTGPSIEEAKNWNYSNCFRHVCNTTILDKELMNHIKPHVISAGDAISHLGISKYAQNFRNVLIKYLRENNVIFFTTAVHGFRLFLKYPDLRKKIILCPQKKSEIPNYNLIEQWWLPSLDSILNIVMLPSAATISEKIYIIGADGKNPDESKNEDFWAHNEKTHFHKLVESGHKCHPTFDINRQKTTLNRYIESCSNTISIGEERFSKQYISLTPSFTKPIGDRYRIVNQKEFDEKN